MTNEEAIECNKNLRMYMKVCDKNQPYKFLEENYIALDMAIKALEQQTCEDTISRSEALSVFRPKGITEEVWKECDVYKKLTALRSVTPKPKMGTWTEKYHETFKYYCNICNSGSDLKTKFCQNCGVKMQEVEK